MADSGAAVRRLDPTDRVAFAAYGEVHRLAEEAESDYPTPFQAEEIRGFCLDTGGNERWDAYLGSDTDGNPVAAGLVSWSLVDNLDKLQIDVWVRPDRRRQGFGSAMVAALLAQARQLGRTTILTHVLSPLGADERHRNRAFAARHGFHLSNSELHRVLDLPVTTDLLDRLAAEAAERHADYRIVEYVDDEMPEELIPGYLELINALMVDAPTGDVTYEPGAATPESFHHDADVMRDQGRTLYRTIALDSTNRPVAHSVLCVPAQDFGKVFQFGTLVRREHRGHRLGLAVKVRNLATVQRVHPERTVVHTWNAASNRHMIAVNEAMGFRVVDESAEYVRRLDD